MVAAVVAVVVMVEGVVASMAGRATYLGAEINYPVLSGVPFVAPA